MFTYFHKLVTWYFGLSAGEPSELQSLKLQFHPPWPASTWSFSVVAAIALSLALVVLLYWAGSKRLTARRRATLLGLRLASLLLAVALLCRPSLVLNQADRPYVLVLLDASASMSLRDDYRQPELAAAAQRLSASPSGQVPTRWQLALSLLLQDDARLLRRLARTHRVRVYTFDVQARRVGELFRSDPRVLEQLRESLNSLSPAGRQTRLGPSVQQVLEDFRGGSVSAVVLLTDGVTTTGPAEQLTAAVASGQTPPLFAVALGSPIPPPDVELHHARAPAVAFLGDVVPLSVRLTAVGLSRRAVRVELVDGRTGRVLSARSVPLEPVAPTDSPETSRRSGQPAQSTDAGQPKPANRLPDGNATATPDAAKLSAQTGSSVPAVPGLRPVTRELTLFFRPKEPGEAVLVLRVVPLPEESQVGNNQLRLRVSVRKARLKVLLADGPPRWEFRQLKALLEREPTVELHTWLQQGDPEYAQLDATAKPLGGRFPSNLEQLAAYDVVILGDVDPAGLGRQATDSLRQFVEQRGGGLLLVAGWSNNPWRYVGTDLEPLLPVVPAGRAEATAGQWTEPLRVEFTPAAARVLPTLTLTRPLASVRPTEAAEATAGASPPADSGAGPLEQRPTRSGRTDGGGGASSVLASVAAELPPLFWVARVQRVKPGAVVLARVRRAGDGSRSSRPLLVLQRYGSGKVLWHGTDELWRWKRGRSERFWTQYWVQTLRALSLTRLVGQTRRAELTADRQVYRGGEPVRLRLHFFDAGAVPDQKDSVRVTLSRDGRAFRELTLHPAAGTPDEFETSVAELPQGEYRATVSRPVFAEGAPSVSFRIVSPPQELDRRTADYEQLRRAAELTGGRFYTLADAARLPDDLPSGEPVWVAAGEPVALWNRWEPLALFVLLVSTEWLLRRHWRLV